MQLGNRDAVKHDLYSARPADGRDGPDASQADMESYRNVWLVALWLEACEHIASLSTAMRERPHRVRSLRNVQQLVSLFEQARTIDAELRASSPPATVGHVFAQAARIFAANETEFGDCMRQVIELRPTLAGELRAVLAEHDAQPQPEPAAAVTAPDVPDGVPRPVNGGPDVVLL